MMTLNSIIGFISEFSSQFPDFVRNMTVLIGIVIGMSVRSAKLLDNDHDSIFFFLKTIFKIKYIANVVGGIVVFHLLNRLVPMFNGYTLSAPLLYSTVYGFFAESILQFVLSPNTQNLIIDWLMNVLTKAHGDIASHHKDPNYANKIIYLDNEEEDKKDDK